MNTQQQPQGRGIYNGGRTMEPAEKILRFALLGTFWKCERPDDSTFIFRHLSADMSITAVFSTDDPRPATTTLGGVTFRRTPEQTAGYLKFEDGKIIPVVQSKGPELVLYLDGQTKKEETNE